ncbi:rhomboid-related protein 3-like isoform X1 [Apostichopus japonicus]|uniref:rhomboid-related protein 3-like isoform X1 n=2 Tax=Stichopus japonicus TaxID=307972 RepID=UPI003AB60C32
MLTEECAHYSNLVCGGSIMRRVQLIGFAISWASERRNHSTTSGISCANWRRSTRLIGFVTYNLPSQKMGTMAVDPVCNNADLRHLTPKIVVLSSADMGMKDRENPDVLECHRVEDDQVQPHNKEEQQRLLIKQALTPAEGRKLGNKEKLLFQTWKPLFDKYDVANKGVITLEAFQVILYKHGLKDVLSPHKLEKLETTIEENPGGNISYTEFVNIMSEKRSLSFSMAIRPPTNEFAVNIGSQTPIIKKLPVHQRFLNFIADEYLPKETDRTSFLNNCSWCLPPVIVLLMCILQFAFYTGSTIDYISKRRLNTTHNVTLGEFVLAGPVLNSSLWIYSPKDQLQFWRFATHCLIHAGIEHLLFNLSIHLLIGFPLEIIHGSRRIGGMYVAAVTLGAMGTSLLDRNGYLCGSSTISYAFLSAHLANSLSNYQTANWNFVRLGIVYGITLLDFACGIYRRYGGYDPPFSYLGHIIGLLVGPTLGLFVLRNYKQKLHDSLGLWLAITLYIVFVILVVIFNIIHPVGSIPGS